MKLGCTGETSNHEVLSFLPSKVLPLGWIWGVLPVMREVQGCDQHGQHITRGSGVEEGSGMVKVSKGLLGQHSILIGLSLNLAPKGALIFPFFREQRVQRKLHNVSRQAV